MGWKTNRIWVQWLLMVPGIWSLAMLVGIAQPAQLTRNINMLPTGESSFPTEFAKLGNTIVFVATDEANGSELWTTDGSSSGTLLVRDIFPGVNGSSPAGLTPLGTTIIFRAQDDSRGDELWRTDGTQVGTVLVKDISPGPGSGLPRRKGIGSSFEVAVLNGIGYFAAYEPNTGLELWKSDGTEAGTVLVSDTCPGSCSGFLQFLSPTDGDHSDVLFFKAVDPIAGQELWKTDGTSAGTIRVMDICPGTCTGPTSSNFGMEYAGGLMFVANQGTSGNELWYTDGTLSGTRQVRDIYSGLNSSNPSFLGVLGNEVYFSATSPDGYELWKSDGTEAGTVQVLDICAGSCNSSPYEFQTLGAEFLFVASDESNGRELWKSDGTAAGTSLILDIDPGPSSSDPFGFSNLNGEVLFLLGASNDAELWKTDGTAIGTVLVRDICAESCGGKRTRSPSLEFFPLSLTHLLFEADDGLRGTELWVTDGTLAGTQLVKDISGAEGSSLPRDLAAQSSGQLLFRADDGAVGFELWASDGTELGTVLVKDIYPGGDSSTGSQRLKGTAEVRGMTKIGDDFFFGADDGVHGVELWKTDGSSSGTLLVKDLRAGSSGSFPTELTNLEGILFLVADQKLWVSDGSTAGTSILTSAISSPSNLIGLNGQLCFVGNDGTHGFELWRSDGTEAGTAMVRDIWPGIGSGFSTLSSSLLGELDGILLFQAKDQAHGGELWKSDGSSSGTSLVKDINPGALDSRPRDFAKLNGVGFFQATTMSEGTELWITDGSSGGTMLLKDICTGACNSSPENLTAVGGRVFFTANDGITGWELWQSDGTPGGTFSMDLFPGPAGSVPGELTAVGDKLVFAASDGSLGSEVWVSDGTDAGTFPVQDLRLGPGSSSPTDFIIAGNNLFFSANDGETGVELWTMPLLSLSGVVSDVDGDMVPDIDDPCPADPTDQCDPNGSSAQEVDASAGGQITTSNGNLSLDIPAGSLDGDTTVSVTATDTQPNDPTADLKLSSSPQSVGLGQIIAEYDFKPDGLIFDPPAELTIKADVTDLSQQTKNGCREVSDPLYDPSTPCKLTVYSLNEADSSFEPDSTAACVVRTENSIDGVTCTVFISHFSVYALIAPADSDNDGVPDLFPPEQDYCPETSQQDSQINFTSDLLVSAGESGLATVLFQGQLEDYFGQAIPGETVVFTASGASGSSMATCTTSTDEAGVAQCAAEQVPPDLYTVSSVFEGVAGCFVGSADTVFLAVFDPAQPRTTGGGYFYPDAESSLPAQTTEDKAHFGFVVEINQDDKAAGNLEFRYQSADINLKSQSVDWYTISNNQAIFQGVATINGEGVFTFRVQAKDGDKTVLPDHLDIVIWQGTDTESDPFHRAKNEVAAGNIVVHKR